VHYAALVRGHHCPQLLLLTLLLALWRVCCLRPTTPPQELWAMLHSASSNESGVPQQLLEAKQAELRERREREAAIQVCPVCAVCCVFACGWV
jgi:hypothetical protein